MCKAEDSVLTQVLTSLNEFLAATSACKEVEGKPSLAGQQDAGVHSADENVLLFPHRCCWVPERLAPHLQTPLAAGPRGCRAGRVIKPPAGARLQRRVQDSERCVKQRKRVSDCGLQDPSVMQL